MPTRYFLKIDIMHSVIDGSDTFAVLPTEYWKSVCYIIPSMMFDKVKRERERERERERVNSHYHISVIHTE